MLDIIWAIGVSKFQDMRAYIIIFAFLVFGYAYHIEISKPKGSDPEQTCLTDEYYGAFFNGELKHLVSRRKKVRESINKNLGRDSLDTLYVPIVFHNIYKVVNGPAMGSYCDFGYDDDEIVEGNDQDICNDRIARSLEVLNAQYAPIAIQFSLHPEYPEMVHATDFGFDGFYLDATGGTSTMPSPNAIKEYYNIPNVLNIYTHECLPSSETSCNTSKAGFSTYPWSLDSNYPGVFLRHKALPGSSDKYYPAENSGVGILAHEIGHFFSLLHINGTWFAKEGNTQRELASGADCDTHGDLICDTPGSPGYVPLNSDPESLESWYYSNDRECVYLGYGGNYDPETSILTIGGYNSSFYSAGNPGYNYCELWGFVDPYGLDNCNAFTNYDNVGDFFGTKNLPVECLNEDKSEYASECSIDYYNHLPIGNNFMQAGTTTLNYCSPRPIGHNDYDVSNHGFTTEQFANIQTSLELDYTACNIESACNTGFSIRKGIEPDMLIRSGESSCLYPCDKIESVEYYKQFRAGCLITDAEYQSNYSQYECSENLSSLYKNIIAQNFGIRQIYPNPFNPITAIDYGLTQNSDVQISIYDINGRLITTLIHEFQIAGYHSITWDASSYSSGIYFLNMSAGEIAETKKMVLIK